MATEEKTTSQFPISLRVLAIDNDSTVLENVKQMCNGYRYQAITYSNALRALHRVRENRDCVDVILIDVNMPNMDCHEFLQRIRKEIDVPVIVMSSDDSTSTKMQSIKLGACDYWKKPLHKDQIRNMWMHVARKAWNENKVEIKSGSLEDDDKKKRGNDDSIIEATGGVVRDQKRCNSEESDVEEPQAKKAKGRVIWAADNLEIKFLKAVMQLGGIDNAVPKRILELMNVPGLTRDNVASHLQKVRHQFQKNKSGKVKQQQQNGKSLPNTVQATTTESSVSASGKIERQAFAVTGGVPCKTLIGDLMPKEEQWPAKQGMTYGHSPLSIFPPYISKPKEEQWPNHPHVEQGMTYGHPALSICPPPPIILNPQSMMNVDEESGYGVWSPSAIPNTMSLSTQERMDTLQVQEQQQMQMNFQPSCMVVSGNSSSVSSGIFHEYTTTAAAASSIPMQVQGGSFPAANTLVPPYSSRSGDSFYEESLVNFRYDDK